MAFTDGPKPWRVFTTDQVIIAHFELLALMSERRSTGSLAASLPKLRAMIGTGGSKALVVTGKSLYNKVSIRDRIIVHLPADSIW